MIILFVLFVFGAVIIGAGAMLAPALPGESSRVGLASTLALAIVASGGILWTRSVGWDTLVIDYLLFGIVSLVVLGGTMVQAHQKATGELDSSDDEADSEWISRGDLLFFLFIGLICLIPLFLPKQSAVNPVTISYGQHLAEIESTYPEFQTIGATGFHILSAYLSQQLQQDIDIVYPAVGSVLAFLSVLTAYDFGAELKNPRTGKMMAVGMLIALSVAYFVLEDVYPLLSTMLFIIAFLTCAIRAVMYRQWQDIIGAIFLAGVMLIV